MADYILIRELYHTGTKGMRWGVRRYQNEDGTLTEEGKLRYRTKKVKEEIEVPNPDKPGKMMKVKVEVDKDMYKGYTDEEVISKVRSKELNEEAKIASEVKNSIYNVASNLNSSTRTVRKDYSQLSDGELRERINRIRLEEEYGRLSGDTKVVKTGEAKVKEVLEWAGTVAALGVSALTIASLAKNLKSGMVGATPQGGK